MDTVFSQNSTNVGSGSTSASPVSVPISNPAWEVARSNYRLRLASSEKDVRAAQLLRFVVFNLELREGLEQSYATCLDADAYDAICDHLIVEDVRTQDVIGTYRLQTGRRAAECLGYYSAQEFDFKPFEPIRDQVVELGRACVHSEHRNLIVLSLLWKGIAAYVTSHNCRYMLGCSSLTSQNAVEGIAAYHQLSPYLVQESFRTVPLQAFVCETVELPTEKVKIPKLLTAYMSLGAKICGPPAMDREFKTIDFLTFLDLYTMPAKTIAKYMS